MTEDFYCEEVLSGRTPVRKVMETENTLAYYHTRPYWKVHIVVIPKKHISSLLTLEESNNSLLLELISTVQQVSAQVVQEHGACRVLTNLGAYQDSKHLHWHVAYGNQVKYTCPCCGYKSLVDPSNDICSICYWEDDPSQRDDPDSLGANIRVTLRQAQKNFRIFGACEEAVLSRVRKPAKSDEKDADWSPLN